MGALRPPEPIHEGHDLTYFNSGEDSLDHWLKHRALDNHHSGASRTFVLQYHHDFVAKMRTVQPRVQEVALRNNVHEVIAFYCLAAGSVVHQHAPGKIKRNMPNPIPVMVLGRLAVMAAFQGYGLGRALLKDAVLRTMKVSQDVGIRALLTHALTPSAKQFYESHGFIVSPLEPMTLMLPLLA